MAGFGLATAAANASAWQEAHQTGGDVAIHLEADGSATVHETIRWHVVRGPLHWIDLENVDSQAVLDPAVTVASDDGRTLTAHALRRDERAVRLAIDEPKAFMRGTFVFDVRWRLDLVGTGALVRDGAAFRLSWSSPLAADGIDSVRTTIDIPAAHEAPYVVFPDTGAPDETALSTLQREPQADVLELVRPHVARGESVRWALHVEPSAFSGIVDPRLRPRPLAPPPEPDRVREVSLVLALGALGLALSLLVAHKAGAFASACAARGVRARALLPLSAGVRAGIAGAAFAAGVGLQIEGMLTAGASLVALAILAAACRSPSGPLPPRGPGRWLVLKPADAFVGRAGGHWLDASSPVGRKAAAVAAVSVAVAAFFARRLGAEAPWLVVLDAAILMPFFATGRDIDLPPDAASAAAPWLAPVFDRLRSMASLRVAPWARVVASRVDELRLLVLPRAVMPGVLGVEVGRAWSTTPSGWAGSPEVLVRVLEGSSAAARLARLLPKSRAMPGRRGEERVVRLVPRRATRACTVALTQGLAEALTDRRVTPASPGRPNGIRGGIERRVTPSRPARTPPVPEP
jgi:hypothetical protein